jgi:hypothetical protein
MAAPRMTERAPCDYAGPGHRWDWPRMLAVAATPA